MAHWPIIPRIPVFTVWCLLALFVPAFADSGSEEDPAEGEGEARAEQVVNVESGESVRDGSETMNEGFAERIRHHFGLKGAEPPVRDEALGRAALGEARKLLEMSREERKEWSRHDLRRLLRQVQVDDYQVKGSFLVGLNAVTLSADMLDWAEKEVPGGWNRFGSALVEDRGKFAVVILLTRRLVRLENVPRRMDEPGRLSLSGSVVPGIRKLEIHLTDPSGKVLTERPLLVASGGFSQMLRLEKRGGYEVQFVVDEGRGPVVATVIAVIVGEGSPRFKSPEFRMPVMVSQGALRTEILRWINRLREENGLSPLILHDELSGLEQRRIAAISPESKLLHTDKKGRGPGERIRRAGFHPASWGENLGRHPSMAGLLDGLANSPSHRRNLLSRDFTHIGLGVDYSNEGRVWIVGQLFARLEEPEIWRVSGVRPLSGAFWATLAERRRRIGLPEARTEPLTRKAYRILKDAIRKGRLGSEALRSVAESAMRKEFGDAVKLVSVIHVASEDDLAAFSGFLQPRWTEIGVAATATEHPEGMAALILIVEGVEK